MNPFFLPGLYCSGWLKTGPTGVIATTMNNSFDTARSVLEDMDSGALDVSAAKPGSQSVSGLLEMRGTLLSPVVSSFSDLGAHSSQYTVQLTLVIFKTCQLRPARSETVMFIFVVCLKLGGDKFWGPQYLVSMIKH